MGNIKKLKHRNKHLVIGVNNPGNVKIEVVIFEIIRVRLTNVDRNLDPVDDMQKFMYQIRLHKSAAKQTADNRTYLIYLIPRFVFLPT